MRPHFFYLKLVNVCSTINFESKNQSFEMKFILADSGGSTTTWVIATASSIIKQFETDSFHPRNLNEGNLHSVIQKHKIDTNLPLYFYGAGCGSLQNQQLIKTFLIQAGFTQVSVFPDTLAVCRAQLKNESGWIGIFGTGSILVHYNGNEIDKQIGGLGPYLGDEGSGYYFGKLLVKQLLTSDEWTNQLTAIFESKANITKQLTNSSAISWLASLAKKTSHLDLTSIHKKNILEFLKENKEQLNEVHSIHLNGSYAYNQQENFQTEFNAYKIQIESFSINPIEKLVVFHQDDTNLKSSTS